MPTMEHPSLDWTHPRLLRNEAEYDLAVAELDALLDLDPGKGTPERDRLDVLTLLVEVYDEAHYPMPSAGTPQGVVDFMLDQRGMTRADLADLLGGKSRVSEFFAGKRRLSLAQIEKLRDLFLIPADLLIGAGVPDHVAIT
jgi:HTH-type transcriptional regulator / antitoxin HigA